MTGILTETLVGFLLAHLLWQLLSRITGGAAANVSRRERMKGDVTRAGGLLARQLRRLPHVSDQQLTMLHVAATHKEMNFALETEMIERRVQYPTATSTYVPLDDLSQLASLSPEQLMLDDDLFYQRLVTKELLRPEYRDTVAHRMRMYILLDVSPSMFGDGALMPDGSMRNVWSRGVVAKQLVDATRGDAQYLLRTFSGWPHGLRRADDSASAERLLEWIVTDTEIGSGTDISRALHQAVEDIRADREGGVTLSHILLITDGEDQTLSSREVAALLGGDIRLHVVLIGSAAASHALRPYVLKQY